MKKTLFLLVSSVLFLSACTSKSIEKSEEKSQQIAEKRSTEVPFIEAKNYFVANTYKDEALPNPKITSQEEFNKYFGMAATMGENGKPTAIDFSKQYAIAVIGKTTDKATTLQINSLKKDGDSIVLNYSQTEGEKQSYKMRPFLLIVVDHQHQGDVKVVKK